MGYLAALVCHLWLNLANLPNRKKVLLFDTKDLLRASVGATKRNRTPCWTDQHSSWGFYSCYFVIPKRNGGMRPILDLSHLVISSVFCGLPL